MYNPGPQKETSVFSNKAEWIQTALMVGRKLITCQWKSLSAPLIAQWLKDLGKLAALENLSYKLIDKMDSFHTKWDPFLTFIGNKFPVSLRF